MGFALFVLMAATVAALLVYWIVLVLSMHDFSRTRKLGFLLIGLFGVVLAAILCSMLLVHIFYRCIDVYNTGACSEGEYTQRGIVFQAIAVGLVITYTGLTYRTVKLLRKPK
jgi:predicted cation transporter